MPDAGEIIMKCELTYLDWKDCEDQTTCEYICGSLDDPLRTTCCYRCNNYEEKRCNFIHKIKRDLNEFQIFMIKRKYLNETNSRIL